MMRINQQEHERNDSDPEGRLVAGVEQDDRSVSVRYVTTSGLETQILIGRDDTRVNLQLRDIARIDLWPLVYCPQLESLWLQYNRITELDLTPLSRCKALREIDLSHNRLRSIDLTPLADCPHLREIRLDHNELRRIDISPLFECPELEVFARDDHVSLTANIFLRSVGSWPDVLMREYHRILWTHGDWKQGKV